MSTPAPLVAVEGLDGAGKNTLTTGLTAELAGRGLAVGRLAFPRYGTTHADLAADALHGRLGGVADSERAMALLFALDRHDALAEIEAMRRRCAVVLLDRYVASNAAYTAARLGLAAGAGAGGEAGAARAAEDAAVDWVDELEFGRLGLPRPSLQVLLATPVALAARRAGAREADDPTRVRDRYERDGDLQSATGAVYERLAAAGRWSPWQVVGPEEGTAGVTDLAGRIAEIAAAAR